jgi:hypothetical protein
MRLKEWSAETPVRGSGALMAIVRSLAIVAETLREIFDESAYQRFLERSCLESSAGAYAIFRRENEQAKARRPRCC